MSLEAALAENTAAHKATQESLGIVAALLKETNEGRAAAVETLSKGPGRGAGSKNKPKDEPAAEPKAETAKVATPPAAPTVDDLRAAAVKFTTVSDDEKPARKDFLKAITDHLGIDKVVNASEGDRAQIITWFEAKARGEDVSFDGEEDAQVEDEDDIG